MIELVFILCLQDSDVCEEHYLWMASQRECVMLAQPAIAAYLNEYADMELKGGYTCVEGRRA